MICIVLRIVIALSQNCKVKGSCCIGNWWLPAGGSCTESRKTPYWFFPFLTVDRVSRISWWKNV